MPLYRTALTLAAVAMLSSPALAQAGDAAKGKVVFMRCAACHSLNPGEKRIGPSLAGIMGRKAGTVAGFTYSPAMAGAKIVWNGRTLDSFFAKPMMIVPGTKMPFAGLPNPADRANLIAYLASATKAP